MSVGILFDLDGTLLDTLEDLLDATNAALRQFGHPERSRRELRSFVGNGARNQIRLSLPQGAEGELDAVLAWYKEYYATHCQIKTAPYPGVTEALARLGEKYPIAIVSNKPDGAVKALCGAHFPGIYAQGERADCPRKPAPEMVYQAMAAIGTEKCVYVGDSEVDILTAQNAGVECLCVLWGFRDREILEAAGGEHFCAQPQELVQALEELCHGQ